MKINNIKPNSELLFFTNHKEKIKDEYIFSLDDNHLTTYNIIGFIGLNDTELTIQSRFEKGDNDYFLHYMLAKVFSINLVDLPHEKDDKNILDFLILLFPHFLKKALNQGIYKEYKRNIYNNMNVKGSIDINLHINRNIPFNGKVAYRIREHHFDNKLTQLIRHTIEFIKKHEWENILNEDETANAIKQITQVTPSYNHQERRTIINQNLRPINHPYFSEYIDLQKICLQILRHQGLSYGCGKNKIYGLLFDGAWLWEEYLNTILKDCGFIHPRNDIKKNPIYLFEENKYERYPDFYNKKKAMVIDAKYKLLNDKNIDRNDMNQIISYMYVLEAKKGVFIHPFATDKTKIEEIGELKGYGGTILKYAFPIPQKSGSFIEFSKFMEEKEKQLKEIILDKK